MPFVIVDGGAPFVPTSMNKTGSHQILVASGGTSWWVVPGWTADSAYPGSTVTDNGLRVSADKVAATVTVRLPFSGGFSASTEQQARVLLNGNVVGTGVAVTGASGTLAVDATVDVLDGSVLTVETSTSTSSQFTAATISATGSYVRIT